MYYRFNKEKMNSNIINILEDDILCFQSNLELKSFCKKIIKNMIKDNAEFLNNFVTRGFDCSDIFDKPETVLKELNKNIDELKALTINKTSLPDDKSLNFEVLEDIDAHLNDLENTGWFELKNKIKEISTENEDIFSTICKIYNKKVNYILHMLKYYCSLSSAKRERIFFLDIHMKLEKNIANKEYIKIKSSLDFLPHSYKIIPFAIKENETHSHYYLLSQLVKVDENTNIVADEIPKLNNDGLFTVRVCSIKSNDFLGKEEIESHKLEEFYRLLDKSHIAYVKYEKISIHIEFDEKSLKEFHTSSYGRPYFKVKNKNTYKLECPLLQVFTYLISFKGNYKIIDNEELKIKLKNHYEKKLKKLTEEL